MIHAKDTFYIMLRDRLAALNPARTMVLRGITRPGILTEENELATADAPPDIFRLRWTGLNLDALGPLPLAAMTCELRYSTAGTPGNGGMDRGRLLAQMDAELAGALQAQPHNIVKTAYSTGGTPVAMATTVFWSDPVFGAAAVASEQVERTATVEVFSYQEVGE